MVVSSRLGGGALALALGLGHTSKLVAGAAAIRDMVSESHLHPDCS